MRPGRRSRRSRARSSSSRRPTTRSHAARSRRCTGRCERMAADMSDEGENWLPHFADTLKSFAELAWRGSWEAQDKFFGNDPKEVLAGTILSFGLGLG